MTTRQGFTFTEAEVEAMEQLFGMLYRGADTRILLRSKEMQALALKFGQRSRKLREARAATVTSTRGETP